MFSKLSRRALWLGVIVAAIASISIAAVATAHKGGEGQGEHHHYGAAGWVTSNTGTTLTLRDFRARAHTFDLNASTKYAFEDGSAATAADAKPGAVVAVRASKPTTTGGNPVAKRVVIQLAHVEGLVQTNAGTTMTVLDQDGFTRTINTTGATCRQGGATVACATIAPNSVVAAKGKVNADGTTLDATRIRSRPPS